MIDDKKIEEATRDYIDKNGYLASFSGKFYGKRSAERRKKKNDMN